MKIIMASNNKGKVGEVKEILKTDEVYSLEDIGYLQDIEEYGNTFHINALIKAQTIAEKFPEYIIIADDSGLCVEALEGGPGVYSARYAMNEIDYQKDFNLANNNLLLKNMENISNRTAYFSSVMCVIKPEEEPRFFSGTLKGEIATKIKEGNGFGYDPLFKCDGKFLSELTVKEKNLISHRGKALEKVINYINKENSTNMN